MTMSLERLKGALSSRLPSAPPLTMTLVALGLAGCVAEMPSPPGNDRFLVEPIRLTHRVTFARGADQLGEAEQYQLAAFLDEADPDQRADIYLDARGDEKNGRIDAVAAALGEVGRQSAGSGGGDSNEHGVTVTLLQDVILPEACLNGDDWPDPRLPPASCTQALTLVHMVENQGDLLRGREMGPALSATAAKAALRHLERGEPSVEERSASGDEQATPKLPPSPLTRDASY